MLSLLVDSICEHSCECSSCQALRHSSWQTFAKRYRKGRRDGWDDDLSDHDLEVLAAAGHDAVTVQATVEKVQQMVEVLVQDRKWMLQPAEKDVT